MSESPRERFSRWTIMVGPLLAALLYAPTLAGTFLSDDFLVNSMLQHGPGSPVEWAEVFADFKRNWAGLDGVYLYRPLVTLSWALTYSIGGMDPLPFHATNVALHVLASLACAALCAACAPSRRGLAAMVGGVLFAAHPIAAESACWIAARTAGLQVAFATSALACFAWHLRNPSPLRLAGATLSFVLALLCKEEAVLVPFSFVALDLWIRGRQAPGGRLRLHGGMFATLVAYFVMRRVLLGRFIGGGEGTAARILHGDPLTNLADKFAMLCAPVGSGFEPFELLGFALGLVVLLGLASVVAPALLDPTRRGLAALGVLWIALQFAPTWQHAVSPANLLGSRMVYGSTAILAAVVSSLFAGDPRRRLSVAAMLLALLLVAVARMNQYLGAYGDMRHLQTSLAEQAHKATEEHPLAMVSISPPASGIPFLNCNALYPLTERPVAAKDTATVGLGFAFQLVPGSEDLLFDVAPLRAMRERGAWLLEWHNNPAEPVFHAQRREPGTPMPDLPALRPIRPGRFVLEGRVDTYDIEAAELVVEGACEGGTLRWLYRMPPDQDVRSFEDVVLPPQFRGAPKSMEFGKGVRRGDETVFFLDLSHPLTFLSLRRFGAMAGFDVELRGAAKALRMRLLPRVDAMPLPGLRAGAAARLDETLCNAPALPTGADSMRLFLIGPDTTRTMEVQGGSPVRLTPDLRDAIRVILRSSRQKRFYLFFEARGTRVWRSGVDWVRLHPR